METALSCMLEMALVSRLVSANCMGVAAAAAGAKAAAGAEAVADGEEDEDQRSVLTYGYITMLRVQTMYLQGVQEKMCFSTIHSRLSTLYECTVTPNGW